MANSTFGPVPVFEYVDAPEITYFLIAVIERGRDIAPPYERYALKEALRSDVKDFCIVD